MKYKKNDWKKINKIAKKKDVMIQTAFGDEFKWEDGSSSAVFGSESNGREIELSHDDIDILVIEGFADDFMKTIDKHNDSLAQNSLHLVRQQIMKKYKVGKKSPVSSEIVTRRLVATLINNGVKEIRNKVKSPELKKAIQKIIDIREKELKKMKEGKITEQYKLPNKIPKDEKGIYTYVMSLAQNPKNSKLFSKLVTKLGSKWMNIHHNGSKNNWPFYDKTGKLVNPARMKEGKLTEADGVFKKKTQTFMLFHINSELNRIKNTIIQVDKASKAKGLAKNEKNEFGKLLKDLKVDLKKIMTRKKDVENYKVDEGKLTEGKMVKLLLPVKDRKKVVHILQKQLKLKISKDFEYGGQKGSNFTIELDKKLEDKVLELFMKSKIKVRG